MMGFLIAIIVLSWVAYFVLSKFHIRLIPKNDADNIAQLRQKYPNLDIHAKNSGGQFLTDDELDEIVRRAIKQHKEQDE